MISRRGFLAGLGAAIAAPAVARIPGLLMPVRLPLAPANALALYEWADLPDRAALLVSFHVSEWSAGGQAVQVFATVDGGHVAVGEMTGPGTHRFPLPERTAGLSIGAPRRGGATIDRIAWSVAGT